MRFNQFCIITEVNMTLHTLCSVSCPELPLVICDITSLLTELSLLYFLPVLLSIRSVTSLVF